MLLTDHIVGSNVLLCLLSPAAPRLLKTKGITGGETKISVTSTPNRTVDVVTSFCVLIQVPVTVIRL